MKYLFLLSALLLSFAAVPKAQALEVGEAAPCVVLNHISPNGAADSEHCIRDPEVDGQYKILEFFSATCSDCARNLPKVSGLAQRLKGKATTRLVGIDRSESLLRSYVSSHRDQIRFEVALDTNRDAKRAYDVVATPTLFVLDQNNVVKFKKVGVLSDSELSTIESIVSGRR